MRHFKTWLEAAESFQIVHIDPEEDWEHGEQAYRIAQEVGIRPDSTKSPTIVAMMGDQVVGAAFTGWHRDEDATQQFGSPVNQFSFDVVVDPRYRWGRTIGLQLIQAAEREKQELQATTGDSFYTRLWVVNPKLAQFLQGDHKWGGYDLESEYEDGSAHIVRHR